MVKRNIYRAENDFIRLFGPSQALRLFSVLGGSRADIPRQTHGPEGREVLIAQRLGTNLAAALVQNFGGERIKIPVGRTFRIAVMAAQGMSKNRIAVEMATSRSAVQRLLGDMPSSFALFAQQAVQEDAQDAAFNHEAFQLKTDIGWFPAVPAIFNANAGHFHHAD